MPTPHARTAASKKSPSPAPATPPATRIAGPDWTLELSVLADDVFRLRIARGRTFRHAKSWVVEPPKESPAPPAWHRRGRTVAAITRAGRCSVRTDDGRWRLVDDGGELLFDGRFFRFTDGKPHLELGLAPDQRIHGLGESTGTFDKRGLIRELWNIDVLGHAPAIHPGLRSLYVSIPFAVSMRGPLATGLFWDNPARQVWDMGCTRLDRWTLAADSGEIDLYLIPGPDIGRVIERFTELTGRMPLPPAWALGFHQCRYSYESRARVEEIARSFRRKRIPCDALHLDIHHLDGYRVFTFGKTFPKPGEMIRRLARRGFQTVCIVDPGVKNDPRFGVLKRGLRAGAFVKGARGHKDFLGKVWPGVSRYPDFLNEPVRRWWGREQARLTRLGVAGFWNDMNEPANFARPDKTLDGRARHRTEQGPRRHAEVHNLYGREMARASREGALAAAPDRRPFIITRAGWAGVQRHAMVWTGDNSSTWQHFEDSLQTLLNLGLSGVPFCGCDAGGFLDNCTPELFIRWLQCAVFTPFLRAHTNFGTNDHEPWSFGPAAEAIVRQYLELRYQLLPCLQSLFLEAHLKGTPIMRPLLWHHADDPAAASIADQFLLGRNLLVAPILRQGATARSVYLPAGDWFSFWTGERHPGGRHIVAHAPLEFIPLFVRGGAVIPFREVQQFTGERPLGEVSLHLWPGGMSSLHWREDDDTSTAYLEGAHLDREILHSSGDGAGRLVLSASVGDWRTTVRKWRVILHGAPKRVRVRLNGRSLASGHDPRTQVASCEFANAPDETTVEWE